MYIDEGTNKLFKNQIKNQSIFLSLNLSFCPLSISFSLSVSPFLSLSFCLSVFLSFCLSVFLSFCLSALLSFCLSVFLPFCSSVFLSFCLSVFLSFCLSVFLSFCLSVCLSFCLSVLFILFKINHNFLFLFQQMSPRLRREISKEVQFGVGTLMWELHF
jgi:hypothetical protein